ncbi:hypothetical protein WJX73_007993 [Symbiochloris irregularis]|uniref:60S ribosomal protein L31 n=1 Tax=Symbiochloris irregularis TaxID=706552 RepID=A0AAW1PZA0_9CHLO
MTGGRARQTCWKQVEHSGKAVNKVSIRPHIAALICKEGFSAKLKEHSGKLKLLRSYTDEESATSSEEPAADSAEHDGSDAGSDEPSELSESSDEDYA